MEIFPNSSACLELTIAIPGLSSSSASLHSYAHDGGVGMKELDINQVPSSRTESEECVDLDDESSNHLGPTRKKLRLTKEQSRILEESFRHNHTLNPKQKETLAEQLKLKQRQVEVWFQNRRARNKLKQTEMECEYLKRWFGSLTEQNKKLQKEVDELRAMKAGPTTHGPSPMPGSTLTMCPRCERVAATGLGEMGPANTKATKTQFTHQPRQLQP